MRKHVMLSALQGDVDPPSEGQHIVVAVGSRGSNHIEVEFADGRRTLCLLPARFHKKLWIKRGNYLIVECAEESDAAVTGQIVAVLYAEHIKKLKKMPGVWPFQDDDVDKATCLLSSNPSKTRDDDENGKRRETNDATGGVGTGEMSTSSANDDVSAALQRLTISKDEDNRQGKKDEETEEEDSSSDDGLPPLVKIQNRRVIHYDISSDSDSD